MAALGVVPPDIEPEVTAHIPQIITMIEQLIANGHAYAAETCVLRWPASMATAKPRAAIRTKCWPAPVRRGPVQA